MNTTTTQMTRTESILTTGIDMEAVEVAGLDSMRSWLNSDESVPPSALEVALEGLWAAGWEWITQTWAMVTAAAAAVTCPRDARLVRLALLTWYEPMGPQEWERLAADMGWRVLTDRVDAELTARRKAGYDTTRVSA